MRVRVSNDLIHWARFFPQGMAETATRGREVFQQVWPCAPKPSTPCWGWASGPTANALVRDFEMLGMLQEITGQQRGRAYAFDGSFGAGLDACGEAGSGGVDNQVPNVMDLDPLAMPCRLNERPATVYGKLVRPDRVMLEVVAQL
jgi:hypothetical protein